MTSLCKSELAAQTAVTFCMQGPKGEIDHLTLMSSLLGESGAVIPIPRLPIYNFSFQ